MLFRSVHETMAFKLKASPGDKWLTYEAAWYQYLYGDPKLGANLLVNVVEQFDQFELTIEPLCNPAIEIAFAYHLLGQEKSALQVQSQCKNMLSGWRAGNKEEESLSYLEARLYALSGNKSAAIASLKKAYDSGWRANWSKFDPLLASVREDAEVQAIFDQIDIELANAKDHVTQALSD